MKNTKNQVRIFSAFALVVLSLFICAFPAAAQQTPVQPQVISNAVVDEPIFSDVSPPLRDLPAETPSQQGVRPALAVQHPKLDALKAAASQAAGSAGALPASPGPLISATIGLNFGGVGQTATNNCPSISGVTLAPPDTTLAVGDTQVVQWVNICYAVFDKATGALMAGPFPGNHFWAGFASTCEVSNAGDIIIQFDKTNHRWVASQNVFGPFLTCVAVSTTADATGSYNRYAFTQPGFPDYPKWGLTPNVYYQTQNDFGIFDGFQGVNVCAYDGAAMRAGIKKVKRVCILDNSNGTLFDDSMLPADNDFAGSITAPNAPEVLLGSIDNPGFNSAVFEYVFTVDFKKRTGTLAGVNGTMPISVPTFNLGCGGFGACIPQPSPGSELLDALGDRLMYRLAHFDNGTTQSWLVTHSVNDTKAVGARWYQFTAPEGSTSLTLAQSGQTPNDSEFRWMGSVAADKVGDIALGYSRSSAAAGDFPSIYYAGQTVGDPAGTTETEALIKQGGGSQFNTANRWGDYSTMALDGADGCTFWYTTEFYPVNGSFAWATQLASLKFPNCH